MMVRPDPEAGRPALAVINVGNTNMSAALLTPGRHLPAPGAPKAARPTAWSLPQVVTAARREEVEDPLPEEIAAFLDGIAPGSLVVVSVVPRLLPVLQERGLLLAVVDHTWSMPFRWDIADPAGVGADRLANVALAAASGLGDVLVVDAGTATTFDLLKDGVFRGGLIAPGMAFSARMLGERAARLPVVPFAPSPLEVGRETRAAMAAGAWHTGINGILGTIAGLRREYGPLAVVLTGGLGRYLQVEQAVWDPHWTLRGGAFLAGLNPDRVRTFPCHDNMSDPGR